MCVPMCVQMCGVHTWGQRTTLVCSQELSTLFPSWGLSLLRNTLDGLHWPAGDLWIYLTSLPLYRTASRSSHASIFMWVLGVKPKSLFLGTNPWSSKPSSSPTPALLFGLVGSFLAKEHGLSSSETEPVLSKGESKGTELELALALVDPSLPAEESTGVWTAITRHHRHNRSDFSP